LLQNVASGSTPADQGIPLALAMTERFLNGRGAGRVHGGGFAGAIQAYVPADRLDDYDRFMSRVFGRDSVISLRIRKPGNAVVEID
jgi:galactokinase